MSVAFGSLRPGEIGTATGRGLSPDPLKGVVSVVFDLQQAGAYGVSALTARGLGLVNYSIGGQRILDGGRGQPAAIRKFLGGSMLYKLTPANPGPRLSGQ